MYIVHAQRVGVARKTDSAYIAILGQMDGLLNLHQPRPEFSVQIVGGTPKLRPPVALV